VAAAVSVVACGGQLADDSSPPVGDAATTAVVADAKNVNVEDATVDAAQDGSSAVDASADTAVDVTTDSAADADEVDDVDASDFDAINLIVPYLARR
jgi:hypothetical protein